LSTFHEIDVKQRLFKDRNKRKGVLKVLKYQITGVITFILIHLSTSITSKEEFSPQLPVHYPVLDAFVSEFNEMAMEMFADSKAPGAAIAIVKDGRIIYGEGFGVKKVGEDEPVDVHTTFRIASVSKTFAGTLTGMLVQDGWLNWDDKVNKYLPEFRLQNPEFTQKLEVKHILSQSTGLIQHAYTNFIEDGKDQHDMITALSEVQLMTEPGKLFSYQNVVYSTIEPILYAATGKDFGTLLKEEIFGPLKMRDASTDYESMMATDNKAWPNFARFSGWASGRISPTYYNVLSAGGINASISDMANYMIALTGHRPEIISQSVLDNIYEPQIDTNIRWKYFSRWKDYKKSYYGLGWRIVDYGDDRIAYHGGYVNGYRSQLAINTNEDIGICILTNSPSNFSSKLVPAFLDLYNEYRERINLEKETQISLTREVL
jgi:beta-lactamase class C